MINDGRAIDRKFQIRAENHKGEVFNEFNSILFLARDKNLIPLLNHYSQLCEESGASEDQLKGVRLLIKRVESYQKNNPHILKVADIDPLQQAFAIHGDE